MSQKDKQTEMSPEKMPGMFTWQIRSKLSIEKVKDKVPAECEQRKFALLQT